MLVYSKVDHSINGNHRTINGRDLSDGEAAPDQSDDELAAVIKRAGVDRAWDAITKIIA